METQSPETAGRSPEPSRGGSHDSQFGQGTTVVYALHGKCTVLAVETRRVGSDDILFYKLEVQKSALSRSTRQEPAIWLPVSSARDRGLRAPMSRDDAASAMAILSGREYFFQPSEPWSSLQPKLEANIRAEGGIGLAKVYSFLYVLRRRQLVPATEVVKLHETVTRVLFRELCDALGETPRAIEDRIAKGLRQKLAPDN